MRPFPSKNSAPAAPIITPPRRPFIQLEVSTSFPLIQSKTNYSGYARFTADKRINIFAEKYMFSEVCFSGILGLSGILVDFS
jgi:hypothetical protein